uniref:Testis-specific serine/threonine-protein kinase 1-like n=1 Tax=Cyprinodon variegatus TaxID=28743 RepID=A0A3Q2CPY5_CYPVA
MLFYSVKNMVKMSLCKHNGRKNNQFHLKPLKNKSTESLQGKKNVFLFLKYDCKENMRKTCIVVYVVMELCPNGDLKDFIASKGTLEEAIQYLHGINIAHRDIKCDNLLLDTNYNLKLCDFSISKRLAYTNGKLVLSSDFCGTPNYQAPEILKHRPYNPKLNDVWSMGIVLYEMLFGSLPFKNRNREEFVRLQMKRRITFPTTSSVSTQAKELIHSILQPVPENRITVNGLLESPWLLQGTMGEIDKAGPSGTKTTTKSSQKTQLDNKLQKCQKHVYVSSGMFMCLLVCPAGLAISFPYRPKKVLYKNNLLRWRDFYT